MDQAAFTPLSNPILSVNSLVESGDSGSVSPLLVYIVRNETFVTSKNHRQKRLFGRLVSWMIETSGRGCQLLRVDLTTADILVGNPVIQSRLFKLHLRELIRRVKRHYGFVIEYFCIETYEGNGVFHMVWAVQSVGAVWIDQRWLSSTWLEIHGASIVYIKRMKKTSGDVHRVAGYVVQQYLAGQSALKRVSWSRSYSRVNIVQGWNFIKKEFSLGSVGYYYTATSKFHQPVTRGDSIHTWNNLLRSGSCLFGGAMFFIKDDRSVGVIYDYEV